MKYVLAWTQYDGVTERVVEKYITQDANNFCFETLKLSEAMVWDSFDEIAEYVEDNEMDDCKIVSIKDKDYFVAKLANT